MNVTQHAWWFLVIKGLFLLAIGLFFAFRPDMAIKGLSFYIGLILLTGGIVAIWNAHRLSRSVEVKTLSYIAPIIASAAGLILLFFPEYALTVFALSIGIWVLFDGIDQLQSAGSVSKFNKGMGRWLIFMGIISLIISIVILVNPYGLIKAMTMFFGVILMLSGAFLMALGMTLRQ